METNGKFFVKFYTGKLSGSFAKTSLEIGGGLFGKEGGLSGGVLFERKTRYSLEKICFSKKSAFFGKVNLEGISGSLGKDLLLKENRISSGILVWKEDFVSLEE